MQMAICPNGGKCGSRRHRVGSLAYKRCLETKATGNSKSTAPFTSELNPPASNKGSSSGGKSYREISMAVRRYPTYKQIGSPIYDGMSLDTDQIQKYIDNPFGLYPTLDREDELKKNITDNIEYIANDALLDIDEMSHDEINAMSLAAFHGIREIEAANALAANTGPRLLVADLADTEMAKERVADALREATANYEVGSDEWYATLADGYIGYMVDRGELQYDLPMKESREAAMESDRQVIAASLKEAIGENDKWLNERNLRGISVIWSGSLNDVAPREEDHDWRDTMVQEPHIVITGAYRHEVGGSIHSTPVRLSGEYRVRVPSKCMRRVDGPLASEMTGQRGSTGFWSTQTTLTRTSTRREAYTEQ